MKTFGDRTWRGCKGLLPGALTVVLTLAVAGCGGSSNGNGEDTRLTAFEFGSGTAREAALLFVEGQEAFLGLADETWGILGAVESGVTEADFSETFCDDGGIATLNATQPFGPGTSAIVTMTNCPNGSIGGTVQYSFTEVAGTPTALIAGDIAMNIGGFVATVGGLEEQRLKGELSFRVVREPGAEIFEFFGRDSYLFWTEGGGTTKYACFDFVLRLSEGGWIVPRNQVVIVDSQHRLFTAFGRQDPVLAFAGQGDLLGGSGLDFLAQVARTDGYCGVVGAPEGIDPGRTSMTLIPDPDVVDGVVLSFLGGVIETTWDAMVEEVLGD